MISTYNLFFLLFKISQKLPHWLFKFNQGTIYSANAIKLRLRDNSNFIFNTVKDSDLEELAVFTGYPVILLKERLQAGDTGIISREIDSQKIKSIQWGHIGDTYIRGMNFKLNIPKSSAYLYWAYSAPEIRITGVFNTAFQKMIDELHEKDINTFYGLVEFWNINAHKWHQRLKFEKLNSVLFLKLCFFRITFLKDCSTKKMSCNINIFKVKDVDII